MALTEVYEVATFYAHFDVVKEGELPPPPITVRVCDSLSCAMAGAEKLMKDLHEQAWPRGSRRACALHGRAAIVRRFVPIGHVQTFKATVEIRSGGGEGETTRARVDAGRRFCRLSKVRRLCACSKTVHRGQAALATN